MLNRRGKKRIIGLVLEEIFSDFSKELIQSIANVIPAGGDLQLMVFAGKYLDDTTEQYDHAGKYKRTYNSIFKLGEVCDADGFIIHLGSISDEKLRSLNDIYGERYVNTPKVFIASQHTDLVTVNYDNESGIREAVNCLVNVNGLDRLCMLGGRDDNIDACLRREIFTRCLRENGITLTEDNYEPTDMNEGYEAACALLDRNPATQAIFCVNDSVAKGLYQAMEERGLTPGKEVLVFGFDNTHMSGEMVPSLSSIGSDHCTLGQKALELLLEILDGGEVESALVPTRLYGRESFHYEMYDYTSLDMKKADPAFIYRMFDDCFYRYRNVYIDREMVNLRRLFFEIMSKMFFALKRRFLSITEFQEMHRMIEVFFAKGAMEYTDASKLVHSIERIQSNLNTMHRNQGANVMMNRLFAHMKDCAIIALSEKRSHENDAHNQNRQMLQDFLLISTAPLDADDPDANQVFRNFDKLGLHNAAVFIYDKPLRYRPGSELDFPEQIRLRCIMKAGELYLLPRERQSGKLCSMFYRDEISAKCRGYAGFPIFFNDYLYGILLAELTPDIYDTGEFIATHLARTLHLNALQQQSEG